MDFNEEVMRSLGRIESGLNAVREDANHTRKNVGTLFDRVSALERWRSWLSGAWAILATGLALIAKGIYGK